MGNAKSDTLQMYATIELNTSTIFQNLIKTRTELSDYRRDTSFTFPQQPDFENPVSHASSFLNSFRTSMLPQPTGSIYSGFDGLASQALSQIADIFGRSLNKALNSIITELVDQIASSKKSIPPDTFQVGTTILDLSALNIPAKLTDVKGQLTTVLTGLYLLGWVGIILTSLFILVSPILFFSRFRRPKVYYVVGIIAAMATIHVQLVALIQTLIGGILGGVINQLFKDYGIKTKPGVALLVLAWLSVILLAIPTTIILKLWFHGTYIRRTNVALEKNQIPNARISDAMPFDDARSQTDRNMNQILHSPVTGNNRSVSRFS
ncbi:hypothetical protein EPUL_005664 [Erysiphe pulchra]|uniref:Uncharacterized protein n=1 Tax=Erysiphe pulchra TaxID=225359 RepID=A0A2S4PME3_9PEZI|nr:hypothetical protein EPUL_005664 [Erysiphe pulchra]